MIGGLTYATPGHVRQAGGLLREPPRLGIHLRRCAVEGSGGLDNLSESVRRPIRGTRRVERESARLSLRG